MKPIALLSAGITRMCAGASRETAHSLARGIAIFLGGFSLLNLLGAALRPGFNGSDLWIRFPGIAAAGSGAAILGASLFWLAFGIVPVMRPWRRTVTAIFTAIILLIAMINATTFFKLVSTGQIGAGLPLPLSLVIALALAFILWAVARKTALQPGQFGWRLACSTALLCAVAFPLGQMVFFGKTDYRRKADAAVVFGARAYADGRPSDALADRVRTACHLYLEGMVAKLIFSGGPGDGPVTEAESMRRMALDLGVSDSDILLDEGGLSTRATARNTKKLCQRHGFKTVLAVSHAFHLPRIKMACQQQNLEVHTVPARESYFLRQMPFLMARETAAWWAYYLC